MVVPLVNPVEQLPEPLRVDVEPDGVCIRADQVAIDIIGTGPEPTIVTVVGTHLSSVVNILGGVMVQTQEVIGSLYHLGLFLSEGWQPVVANQVHHNIWIFPKEKRVMIPSELKLNLSVDSIDIILASRIVWFSKLRLSAHSNDSSLFLLIFFSVSPDCLSMS